MVDVRRGRRGGNQSGVTLVELMVATVILIVILSITYGLFAAATVSWQNGNTKIDLRQEARNALREIEWELRQTRPALIDLPADGIWRNSVNFSLPTGVNADGSLVWGNQVTFILLDNPDFYGANQVNTFPVIRADAAGTNTTVANYCNSIQFRRQAVRPEIVEINIIMQKNTIRGYFVGYNLTGEVNLRN